MKFSRWWIVYLLLLSVSTAVRWWQGGQAYPAPGQQVARLATVGGSGQSSDTIEMVFQDLRPPGRPAAPVVLLLHGSPVASPALGRLIAELRGDFRLIVPDLPGMGRSTARVPDYSVRAHAVYADALLQHLSLERVHVAAYSMGGGVAIELAQRAPARVASLSLISGLGVQEHELLGQYHLNHAVHALQWLFFWVLDGVVPHFGWLDWFPLNTAYARNFLDTDQRPLRDYLVRWAGPTLIVHGEEDHFVPTAAAREHARLVPQSELVLLPGGHGLIFSAAVAEVGQELQRFVRQIDEGRGVTRAHATPERLAAAQPVLPRATGVSPWSPQVQALMLGLLALATLASEDLACIGAGLLVASGHLAYGWAVLACFCGIFIGDLALVCLGRWCGGRAALQRWPWRLVVSATAVAEAESWFARRGARLMFACRFLPGMRLPVYVAAGVLRVPWRSFIGWFALAAALWTPLLVGAAWLLGEAAFGWLQTWATGVGWAVVGVALLWLLAKSAPALLTWRGRRLLLGRWRRLTRWEFWPSYALYPPVVVYCLWLAWRYRRLGGLRVCTAANPGIGGGGGLVGESKAAILTGLAGAGEHIAAWVAVPPGSLEARRSTVLAFSERVGWPVVLKPDVGERGRGVHILRTADTLDAALLAEPRTLVAQAYVPGVEFGVFYLRHPLAAQGELFALTEKRLVEVVGDGRRDLATLILAHDRAVCMGAFFLQKWQARAADVPAKGEVITLSELGTHSRGAVFLDGGARATPALLAAVEHVSRQFKGFHLGRYDVRAASVAAFCAGEFKVIELNGLTSEPTSMYDPSHTVWFAWTMLCRQWHHAYAIGAANLAAGAPLTTWAEIRAGLKSRPGG